jgi:GNAT superfamily N-acetyltransferase
MSTNPYVVLEWNSSSLADPSGEPTDYVYENRGDLIDVGEGGDRIAVGKFGCYYMDIDRALNDGMPACDVFDAYASTIVFYDKIFDAKTEEYSSRIEKLCHGTPLNRNVLILDRLEILPKYRGKKLGLEVLRHMIQRFGAGAGLVALKAFPLQFEAQGSRDETDKWRSQLNLSKFKLDEKIATTKLITYYTKLGFERLPRTKFMFRSNDLVLPDIATD